MEEYEGITVMTTNYLENIDPAFFRRISYIIHFPFPDVASRLAIWQGIFPSNVPMDEDDVDFNYLAKQFEISGGSIKNIALTAAFLAVDMQQEVGMAHIIKAVKYELMKQKKIVLKEDFGEYGFLL
jgi:ATP-dependent 26S proteasome regulatory subunit